MTVIHRHWVKTQPGLETSGASRVTFYDAGDYWGEHYEDNTWVCYKILKRERTPTGIHEILEKMYDEFVPWDIISTETYPVFEMSDTSLVIPGWRLTTIQ